MSAVEGSSLVLTDSGNPGNTLSIAFVGGEAVLSMTGVTALSVQLGGGGERVRITPTSVRVDGGERIELHGDDIVRIDAGGTGMTLSPDYWTFYLPGSAAAFLPAPPEHPDTGGNTYTLGGGALDEHLADYLARFPDTVGLPN